MEATHFPSEGKARQKLTIMRKLAGTTWGTDEQILMASYQLGWIKLKSISFIHDVKKLKTIRCSCPRHVRYSHVYG